jgi:hypothetical protein
MFTRTTVAILTAYCLLFASFAHADSSADLLKQLQDQKAVLDAQKGVIDSQTGILTSQKALIDAKNPQFAGGKSGETTFGSSVDVFHANLYAYSALNTLAGKLCKLETLKNSTAIVLSSDDLASIAAASLLKEQLDGLITAYNAALNTTPPQGKRLAPLAAGYAAAMALSAAADFTRLFRTDQKVSQEVVTISDSDLANELSACAPQKFLLATSLAMPALLTQVPAVDSLWGKYMKAAALRATAQAVQIADDAELATMDKTKLPTPLDRSTFIDLQTSTDRLKALSTAHSNLDPLFTGSNDTTKEPNLLRLLRGEALLKKASESNTVLLTASVVLKGGFSVVSQSIWRADKFYSRGGLAVSYRAVKTDGSVLAAGVLSEESKPAEVHFH